MANSAYRTNFKTDDGLTIYDLDPKASELWACAGPDGVDPRTIDTLNLPDDFRWVTAEEWELVQKKFDQEVSTSKRLPLNISLSNWKVHLTVDSDGHLGIFVKHNDGSEVMACEADIGDEKEFAVRLTTSNIEEKYSLSQILQSLINEEVKASENTHGRTKHYWKSKAFEDCKKIIEDCCDVEKIKAQLRELVLEESSLYDTYKNARHYWRHDAFKQFELMIHSCESFGS